MQREHPQLRPLAARRRLFEDRPREQHAALHKGRRQQLIGKRFAFVVQPLLEGTVAQVHHVAQIAQRFGFDFLFGGGVEIGLTGLIFSTGHAHQQSQHQASQQPATFHSSELPRSKFPMCDRSPLHKLRSRCIVIMPHSLRNNHCDSDACGFRRPRFRRTVQAKDSAQSPDLLLALQRRECRHYNRQQSEFGNSYNEPIGRWQSKNGDLRKNLNS